MKRRRSRRRSSKHSVKKRYAMPDEPDLSFPDPGSLQRGRFTDRSPSMAPGHIRRVVHSLIAREAGFLVSAIVVNPPVRTALTITPAPRAASSPRVSRDNPDGFAQPTRGPQGHQQSLLHRVPQLGRLPPSPLDPPFLVSRARSVTRRLCLCRTRHSEL